MVWRGTGGGRPGDRGQEVYGRWEKRGKQDSQGGGKREKKGKIMQHCAMFRNPKNAKRQESTNTRKELGLKGMGSGRFKPPCPPHNGGPVHGDPHLFLLVPIYSPCRERNME